MTIPKDSLRSFNRISRKIKETQEFIRKSLEVTPIGPGTKITTDTFGGVREDTHTNAHLEIGKGWRKLKNYPRAIGAYRLLIERHPLMLSQTAEA